MQGVREVVSEAFMVTKGKHRIKWDSTELSKWVTTLSERVFALQVQPGTTQRSEEGRWLTRRPSRP